MRISFWHKQKTVIQKKKIIDLIKKHILLGITVLVEFKMPLRMT